MVVTDSPTPVAPCGACRQALVEFGDEVVVESIGRNGARRWRLAELLPHGFRREDLNT